MNPCSAKKVHIFYNCEYNGHCYNIYQHNVLLWFRIWSDFHWRWMVNIRFSIINRMSVSDSLIVIEFQECHFIAQTIVNGNFTVVVSARVVVHIDYAFIHNFLIIIILFYFLSTTHQDIFQFNFIIYFLIHLWYQML